jgi:nucleotide-binding universal stress UspA family protein
MNAASDGGVVLCGVDQSPQAEAAAALAGRFAALLRLQLVLLHAADPPLVPLHLGDGQERLVTQTAFDRAGALRTVVEPISIDEPVQVTRMVEFGGPAEVIRTAASELRAELVVVGARGQSAVEDLWIGSTSSALAQAAPCPVVLTPAGSSGSPTSLPGQLIMCGVDGSEPSVAATRSSARLAERLGVPLVLAYVARADEEGPVEAAAAAARAAAPSIDVEIAQARGEITDVLIALAQEREAGLIAVGSRGRGSIKAALLGSVSRSLVRAADRPVLVVSPGVDEASAVT